VTGALKVIVNRSETQKDSVDMREGLTGIDAHQTFSEYTYEGRRIEIWDEMGTQLQMAKDIYADDDGEGTHDGHHAGADDYSPYADPPRTFTLQGRSDFRVGILLDGTGQHKGQIPEYDKYGHLAYTDDDPDGIYEVPTDIAETGYSDIEMHPRNSTELLIRALKPGSSFHSSGSRALHIAERSLSKYYAASNSKYGSKYTNYSCFNFFPTDYKSTVMYPNVDEVYNTSDNFTIEFYVKINHNTGSNTVMHLPRDFCVTIISGSETDHRGYPERYAIASLHGVKANHVQSLRPDNITDYAGGEDHIRQSDFVLKPERWHHCAIRYDSTFKTLEYLIDTLSVGKHQLAAAPTTSRGMPLILGAHYSGTTPNLKIMSASWDQGSPNDFRSNADKAYSDSGFTNFANINLHEIRLWNKYLSRADIISGSIRGYTGSAPELSTMGLQMYVPCLYDADKIRNTTNVITGDLPEHRTDLISGSVNSEAMIVSGTQAQVEPYAAFDWQLAVGSLNPELRSLSEHFENSYPRALERIYRTPYNTNHANIGGFANMNIQNFSKDFVNTVFPVTHHMSESLHNRTVSSAEYWHSLTQKNTHVITSSFLDLPQHQKRNCFILPCDNGNFRPGYGVLTNITGTIYLTENGETINTKNIGDLDNILDSRLFFIDEAFSVTDGFMSTGHGSTIEQQADSRYNNGLETIITAEEMEVSATGDIIWPSVLVPTAADLRSFFDAQDFTGNLVTVITIPQLFYGDKIRPESFQLKSYLHTGDKSEIILKDDGEGNLYRSQTSGSVATWNSVGDIFYNEGMVYIRNPSLYAIGDQNLDISFEGVNAINAHEVNVFAYPGLVNSSSNPNYNKLIPSSNENETADEFVYISTVYLHDDNLNVIGKAKMAQPVIKRSENKYLFRLRIDF